MRLRKLWAAPAGVVWCTIGRLAGAQLPGIGVDPHMLVLTDSRPNGEMTVLNPRPGPAQFSVEMRFGYPTSDSTGAIRVELREDGAESAAPWVSAYPARFALRGASSRTVRIVAHPPDALPAGEYWARVVVHSRDTIPPSLEDSAAVRVRLALETASVVPLFFRKGEVQTGVTVDSLEASADGDAIEIRAAMTRTGAAAFVGIAHLTVSDSTGRVVVAMNRTLAVYKALSTRWRVPLAAPLPPGPCSVVLRLSTDRQDVERRLLVSAPDVERRVSVRASPPR